MISIAQKKARENFKKAIEYRKKTGCSLKQAFAHISGKKTVTKKVGTVKKDITAYDVLKYREKVGEKKFRSLTPAQRVKNAEKNKVLLSPLKKKKVLGALPIGFKGKLFDIDFKIVNQYDIYGDVSAIMEDTKNGNTITVFDGKGFAKDKAECIVNYINKISKENYTKVNSFYSKMLKFATNMQNEVKAFNAGKKKTIKKTPLIVAIPKSTVKKSASKKDARKKETPKKSATKKHLKYAGTMHSQDGKKMYKYSLGKKPTEKTILNKIHKVKHDVDSLDEAQHKHMISGIDDKIFKDLYDTREKIANTKKTILKYQEFAKLSPNQKKFFTNKNKQYKKYLVELNTHYREIKKHI